MTRVLYWNIENFSRLKIAGGLIAANRLAYMVQAVMRGPVGGPIPDIIILVEVFNRIREVGTEGIALRWTRPVGQGLHLLLAALRADPVMSPGGPGAPNWCMVPPLILGEFGQCEAVGVFFNATHLQFTGPNILFNLHGGIGWSQPATPATLGNRLGYSPNWLPEMPAPGRQTVFGGVAVPENELAGEWQYYTFPPMRPIPSPPPPATPPNRIHFPNQGCRGPYQTRFTDHAHVGGLRTLNFFAIHTSPATAGGAVATLPHVPPIAAVPPAVPGQLGQVNVVVGDFNLDPFFPLDFNIYNPLLAPLGIYTMLLDPRVAHAGPARPARKPYCMTHLLRGTAVLPAVPDAKPYNAIGAAGPNDPQHNVYPRYGYMGESFPVVNNSGAIDNALVAYGAGLAAPPANNITVVNTITGTPYNAVAPPPGAGVTAELTGGMNFPSHFPAPNMLLNVPPATAPIGGIDSTAPAALAQEAIFQTWNHFRIARSTSDHLPLIFDV